MKQTRIKIILESIDKLKKDLAKEYDKLALKYDFFINNKKIIFSEKIKKYQKSKMKENIFEYIITADIKHLLIIPFIYFIIIPALFLDFLFLIYQYTVFPLCNIPLVKRKDYFVYDRRFLKYLNILQKFNCLYCSYVNGLFAYAVEIGGRTEQYWCPIKHAQNRPGEHIYFKDFSDFGDPDGFNEIFNKNVCFNKNK